MGPANLAYVHLDGQRTRVLLDDGSQINSVTPVFAKSQGYAIGPLEELVGRATGTPFQGVGGTRTGALGYVIFRIQIEGIPSYDEEQVALVIEDSSAFSGKVPVILGTPTLHRVIRSMRETEMHEAPMAWQQIKTAYEITNDILAFKATYEPETPFPTNTGKNPTDLDEVIHLSEKFELPAFSSMIVKGRTKDTMMMGEKLRVMTQAPYFDDEANLPNGLYVCRTYTELKDGSRNVNLVVRNGTSRPISMSGGRIIGRVVAANLVPEAEISAELMKEVSKEDEEIPKLSTQERQKLLMEVLAEKGGLQMLDSWKTVNAEKARQLLMEYHNVFSLEKNEMGCTDTTEHVIELTKSEPFKERFRQIAPPLMEEVRQHLQEMLDGGAIRPSNSPWCNAVVLVRKKDGTLRFCIDFRRLNDRTKKDAHPMPRMPEIMESMVGAKIFSCMDLKSGFWQVKMAEESRQYTAFTVGSLGVYEFLRMPFGLCNAPATFQRLMQNCLGKLNLTYALVYLDDVVVFFGN